MSGSSLDGLDAAWCSFSMVENQWKGKILQAETFSFPPDLEISLKNARQATGLELLETETPFLNFCQKAIESMLMSLGRLPLAISSHGHTVFHNPSAGYTLQIGNGGLLSGKISLPVISDFRTLDVGNGGQGAPLVPGAERFLFPDFDACLNLGGISNISFPGDKSFFGFDISPCNQLLNLAASWLGLPYDKDGLLASSGNFIPDLMKSLDDIAFYAQFPPKSLGNEDVAMAWEPLLLPFRDQPENVLHTLCHHISRQIGGALKQHKSGGKLLVTGGGAFNSFLISCLRDNLGNAWQLEVPEPKMISFKEAYCFAFLGLMRLINEKNVFRAVTGAKEDLVSGAVYGVQWLKM